MVKRRNTLVLAFVASLALSTSGCADLYLADDIDLDFNWSPLEGVGSTLHVPYVVGTQVTISAHDANDEEAELSFVLESSDESVLRIDSQSAGTAYCTAVGEGEAEVRVLDDGDEVYSRVVTVRDPTRAELYAHGPLIIGLGQEEALAATPIRIVNGGMGTFLVRYYDGNERLYGNGVLSAVSDGEEQGLTLAEQQTFLFENREWLQISGSELGTYDVDLFVGDINVGQGVVEIVDAAEVASFSLLAEDDDGASPDESLAVLAQAYDGAGEPVYGVEYTWDLGGVAEPGEGDLFRYTYEADETVDLEASFQGLSDAVTIHASEGYVSSTNSIGCSAAPGVPGVPDLAAGAGMALFLTVLAVRRRR